MVHGRAGFLCYWAAVRVLPPNKLARHVARTRRVQCGTCTLPKTLHFRVFEILSLKTMRYVHAIRDVTPDATDRHPRPQSHRQAPMSLPGHGL